MGKTSTFLQGEAKRKNHFFQKNPHDLKVKNQQEYSNKNRKLNQKLNAHNKSVFNSARSSESFFVKPSEPSNTLLQKNEENINQRKHTKKQFDKKTWRLQNYSKKYKLQQWEEKRNKAILQNYYRTLESEPNHNVKKNIYDKETINFDIDQKLSTINSNKINENHGNNYKDNLKKKSKNSNAFKKAQNEFERIKREKLTKREEKAKQTEEREEAMLEYKKKKAEKFRKLSRKTKKGQPVMKDRIEMLFEKIQNSVTK